MTHIKLLEDLVMVPLVSKLRLVQTILNLKLKGYHFGTIMLPSKTKLMLRRRLRTIYLKYY